MVSSVGWRQRTAGAMAPAASACFGHEQPRRGARSGLGRVGDGSSHVPAAVRFVRYLHIEGHASLAAGKRAHDLLHPSQDLRAAALPVRARLHGTDAAPVVVVLHQVQAVQPVGSHLIPAGGRRRQHGGGDGAEEGASASAKASADRSAGRGSGMRRVHPRSSPSSSGHDGHMIALARRSIDTAGAAMPTTVVHFTRAIVRRPSDSSVDGLRSIDRGTPDVAALRHEHRGLRRHACVARRPGRPVAGPRGLSRQSVRRGPGAGVSRSRRAPAARGAVAPRRGGGVAAGPRRAVRARDRTRRRWPCRRRRRAPDAAGGLHRSLVADRHRRRHGPRPRAGLPGTPCRRRHATSRRAPPQDRVLARGRRHGAGDAGDGRRAVCSRASTRIVVPEGEEAVANALCVNGAVLIADGFPKTTALLARRGYDVRTLKLDEVMKLDAGLSCMSLRWIDRLTPDA